MYASASDQTWPRISIVTPSYNQAHFLEDTIRSVLDQGYPNLEYVVVDGGSTDGSVEIIRRYAQRLTGWISEPDGGQSHAINKGLAQCSGEIFNWINSDDQLVRGALHEVGRLWRRTRPHLLIGRGVVVDHATGRTVHDWQARAPRRPLDFIAHTRVVMPQPSSFVSAELVRALGGVREDLHYVMDWELYLRITTHLRRQLVAVTTARHLSTATSHADTKTNRAPESFQSEAEAVLRDMRRAFTRTERARLALYLWIRQTERSVVASRPYEAEGLTRLATLFMRRPDMLGSRFFWGAVRRAMVASRP